jgi:DNA modification methylase
MSNFDELLSLATAAGLHSTIIRSSNLDSSPDASETQGKELFDVCVAAPHYDSRSRYRSFNVKCDGAKEAVERNVSLLRQSSRTLASNGLMFIYGLPCHLVRYATALSDDLAFRYWVAIRAMTSQKSGGLRPEHTGLLILSKPGAILNRVRIPHANCRNCGEALKDWGGKSHLRNPEGVALSDVWMDLVVNPDDRLPPEVFERILQLSSNEQRARLLLLIPEECESQQFSQHREHTNMSSFNPLTWSGRKEIPTRARALPESLMDSLHKGPCLDVLKLIPSETVDLAFADPPFNLTKKYNGYSDDRKESDYLGWCKRWLLEYERVLKPGGAIFILNLPRWSAQLADFMSRSGKLYLQNWVVWDSLPEPKGVIMPAHYALLYLTKGETASRFNYCSMENGWEPFDEAVFPPDRADVCQRRGCVKRRRASSQTWRGELTDIWHDIHRVRRPINGARFSKTHPCQTPERLVDRIIRLTTNPRDVVLDAFAGTGTTAMVARRLNRRYIAIEQDDNYLDVASRRVSEYGKNERKARPRVSRKQVSKRSLQIELQRLALRLGRLPTRADVETLSRYKLSTFDEAFDSWREALKAAKAVEANLPDRVLIYQDRDQVEMFEQVSTSPATSETAV